VQNVCDTFPVDGEEMMATLNLTSLRCERKQDVSGLDEPQITVNGDIVWGPGKMEKESTVPLNVPVSFGEVAQVVLHEMNGNKPKQIGAAQSIRVDRPGSPVNFSTSGAHYILRYNVVD
jgi:hypothetical protein